MKKCQRYKLAFASTFSLMYSTFCYLWQKQASIVLCEVPHADFTLSAYSPQWNDCISFKKIAPLLSQPG